MIDISKYTSFFHDGSVISIVHTGNRMIILMESAEIDKKDLREKITLSKTKRIRGKLHIDGIKNILINKRPYTELVKKTYDEGGIINFDISQNCIELAVEWVNFAPKTKVNEYSVIKVNASQIWWENIPKES